MILFCIISIIIMLKSFMPYCPIYIIFSSIIFKSTMLYHINILYIIFLIIIFKSTMLCHFIYIASFTTILRFIILYHIDIFHIPLYSTTMLSLSNFVMLFILHFLPLYSDLLGYIL